jgi:hypothetical protein
LEPGEIGNLRVVGTMRGTPPLLALPPVSDRAGNVYVMQGAKDLPEVATFVARAGATVYAGCRLTKGERVGAHGWVGFSQDRQWYWSGFALVSLSGDTGDCRRVLDRDPSTGADLLFRAVIPQVYDTPLRTSVVALVQSPTDPAPFTVVVDLNARIFSVPRPFEPAAATDVTILGVGAAHDVREGVVLLSFIEGGVERTELRYTDQEGQLIQRVPVQGLSKQPAYAVRGYMQIANDGLGVALLPERRVLTFDKSGARLLPSVPFDAVGVHKFGGRVFLVGVSDGRPVLAAFAADGSLGTTQAWAASERVASELTAIATATDDRTPPRRPFPFENARSAIGAFPFMSEHSPDPYSEGQSLWLFGGPGFGAPQDRFTFVAVAPVGISYP